MEGRIIRRRRKKKNPHLASSRSNVPTCLKFNDSLSQDGLSQNGSCVNGSVSSGCLDDVQFVSALYPEGVWVVFGG